MIAQGFKKVFKRRNRIGKRIDLRGIRDAPQCNQLALGKSTNRGHQLRDIAQLEDAQGAGHLIEQARYIAQLCTVPIGFNERHKRLSGLREVGNRLLDHGIQQQLGFVARQRTIVAGAHVHRHLAQARNLIVERCFDVQQGAGDIEQGSFVGRAIAANHFGDGLTLLLYHTSRHAQTQHAQGVGNTIKHVRLRVQRRYRVTGRAHVQVKHVLDAQQILFDRATYGIEQCPVVTGHAALGVGNFRFGRQVGLKPKHIAHLTNAAIVGGRMRDEVEQLAGQFQWRVFGKRRITGIGKPLDLTLDARQRAFERLGRLKRTRLQCLQRATGNPE